MRFSTLRGRVAAGAALVILGLATPAASLADHGNGPANGSSVGYHGAGTGAVSGPGTSNGYTSSTPTPQVVVPVPAPAPVSTPSSPVGYHGAGSGAVSTSSSAVSTVGSTVSHAATTTGNNGNGNSNGYHGTQSGSSPGNSGHTHPQSSSTSVVTVAQTATTPAAPAPAASSSAATPAATTVATPAATTPAAPSATPAPTTTTVHGGSSARRASRSRARPHTTARPGVVTRGGGATARAGSTAGAPRGTARLATVKGGGAAGATRPGSGSARRAAHHVHRSASGSASASTPLVRLGTALGSVPTLVNHLVPLPVPDWSKPIIAALVLVCLLLALRVGLTARRTRRLETQRAQLSADLALMQAALIPEIPSAVGALGVSAAYRPADGPGAGGDFYDAFALDDARVAVILGDVSGHGRTALRRAAHMHYTLRAYVEMGLDPRSALKLAGRVQREDESDLFTTVVVAIHDATAGTLTYASAGHPAPIVQGPDAPAPLRGSASPPLGWGVATGRRQTTIPFPEGTRACFFTDGVTEARAQQGLIGRDELARIVAGLDGELSAQALLSEVRRRSTAVHDDMAACVITSGAGEPGCAPRVEELEVDVRQLAAGQGDRFLSACGVRAAEATRTLAIAHAIAAESGTALLRVEFTRDGAMTDVARPAPLTLEAPVALAAEPTVV